MKLIVLVIVLLAVAGLAVAQSPPGSVIQRGEAAFKNNGCYGSAYLGSLR